jgi:cytochrome c-type biogenesis protein CcmH
MGFDALMSFWLPAAAISLIVIALSVLGLRRGARVSGSEPGTKREMRIYADQLREIERDQARGVVSADEAERLRAETARRLLEADKKAQTELRESPSSMKIVALILVLLMPITAGAFYWSRGAPGYQDMPLAARFAEARQMRAERLSQTQLEAAWERSPNRLPQPPVDPEYTALMTQLRTTLAERPDDLRGQRLLATNEANLGNFSASAAALVRIIEIQGSAAPVEDMIALAETMVQATGGSVSPEAEVVLERILQRDPRNGPARYYLGLSLGQIGRPDLTFRLWRGLLEDSNPDAPWVPIIRSEIEQLAEIAGVRYTLPALPTNGLRGPSAEDMAAAADMTAEDREAMIGSMVEGLASRLANQGGTPDEWARLIGALGALGQTDRARAIWAESRMVFADQPSALATIQAAAAPLGFTE